MFVKNEKRTTKRKREAEGEIRKKLNPDLSLSSCSPGRTSEACKCRASSRLPFSSYRTA